MKKFVSVLSLLLTIAISVAAFTKPSPANHAIILQEICTECGWCIGVCPVDAIKQNNTGYYVDEFECIACGTCMNECPVGAIWMESL